jgi:glutathione S-transferase
MITISAFKWVPDFAQGQVRDLRARWALEEAGLPYRTRLLEQGDQDKPDYRALQPFGQVPILEEDGLVLFESGAIVLYIGSLNARARRRGARQGRSEIPQSGQSERDLGRARIEAALACCGTQSRQEDRTLQHR